MSLLAARFNFFHCINFIHKSIRITKSINSDSIVAKHIESSTVALWIVITGSEFTRTYHMGVYTWVMV